MELASKIKNALTLWLCAMVVTLSLGETRAGEFFAAPPHESGQIQLATQASVGENYDAWQYDASGYAVAPKRTVTELLPGGTTGNYRTRYLKADPGLPEGWQVHHTVPQKYQSLFEDVGIDIGDLQHLRGVDPKIHSRITTEWGRFDKRFGGQPNAADVSRFVQDIDRRFADHLRVPGF